MKELEERIDNIYKGELEVLRKEYDYAGKLSKQLPEINEQNKILYGQRVARLLNKAYIITMCTYIMVVFGSSFPKKD